MSFKQVINPSPISWDDSLLAGSFFSELLGILEKEKVGLPER